MKYSGILLQALMILFEVVVASENKVSIIDVIEVRNMHHMQLMYTMTPNIMLICDTNIVCDKKIFRNLKALTTNFIFTHAGISLCNQEPGLAKVWKNTMDKKDEDEDNLYLQAENSRIFILLQNIAQKGWLLYTNPVDLQSIQLFIKENTPHIPKIGMSNLDTVTAKDSPVLWIFTTMKQSIKLINALSYVPLSFEGKCKFAWIDLESSVGTFLKSRLEANFNNPPYFILQLFETSTQEGFVFWEPGYVIDTQKTQWIDDLSTFLNKELPTFKTPREDTQSNNDYQQNTHEEL